MKGPSLNCITNDLLIPGRVFLFFFFYFNNVYINNTTYSTSIRVLIKIGLKVSSEQRPQHARAMSKLWVLSKSLWKVTCNLLWTFWTLVLYHRVRYLQYVELYNSSHRVRYLQYAELYNSNTTYFKFLSLSHCHTVPLHISYSKSSPV